MNIKGSVSFSTPSLLIVKPNTCSWLWTEIKSKLKR